MLEKLVELVQPKDKSPGEGSALAGLNIRGLERSRAIPTADTHLPVSEPDPAVPIVGTKSRTKNRTIVVKSYFDNTTADNAMAPTKVKEPTGHELRYLRARQLLRFDAALSRKAQATAQEPKATFHDKDLAAKCREQLGDPKGQKCLEYARRKVSEEREKSDQQKQDEAAEQAWPDNWPKVKGSFTTALTSIHRWAVDEEYAAPQRGQRKEGDNDGNEQGNTSVRAEVAATAVASAGVGSGVQPGSEPEVHNKSVPDDSTRNSGKGKELLNDPAPPVPQPKLPLRASCASEVDTDAPGGNHKAMPSRQPDARSPNLAQKRAVALVFEDSGEESVPPVASLQRVTAYGEPSQHQQPPPSLPNMPQTLSARPVTHFFGWKTARIGTPPDQAPLDTAPSQGGNQGATRRETTGRDMHNLDNAPGSFPRSPSFGRSPSPSPAMRHVSQKPRTSVEDEGEEEAPKERHSEQLSRVAYPSEMGIRHAPRDHSPKKDLVHSSLEQHQETRDSRRESEALRRPHDPGPQHYHHDKDLPGERHHRRGRDEGHHQRPSHRNQGLNEGFQAQARRQGNRQDSGHTVRPEEGETESDAGGIWDTWDDRQKEEWYYWMRYVRNGGRQGPLGRKEKNGTRRAHRGEDA